MSLTKEDLSAIEAILDRKIGGLDHRMDGLDHRMDSLDQRMDGLDHRMDSLDQRMDGLDHRMDSLDQRMDGLDHRMDSLDQRMDGLDQRVGNLENDMRYIKVDLLENNIIPRLSTIESCYISTYDRYKEGADKFDNAFDDIAVMKKAIRKNSEDIQTLMLKQA